jgi:DNA-binding response OmpR family regulator
MHVPQILVVDDDLQIRKLLARYVQEQGFRVQLASKCAEARERINTNQIDLIVLDVMLPDGSGLDFCRDLRATKSNIPIILLTALKEDIDRIIGLEIGADDYLGKPFNARELVARIRAVLRRSRDSRATHSDASRYVFEGFTADPSGRVLTRDQLLDLTRGRDGDVLDRSIDVLVSRLRRKLSDGVAASLFKTVRNGGYQLAAKVVQLEEQQ